MNQRVYDFFSLYGKQNDIIELDDSSATVTLAAKALGCEEREIAKMIPGDILYDLTGFEVGGVCPFNPKENVKVYLDESLKKLSYCYPACGSHNNAIKVSLEELQKVF